MPISLNPIVDDEMEPSGTTSIFRLRLLEAQLADVSTHIQHDNISYESQLDQNLSEQSMLLAEMDRTIERIKSNKQKGSSSSTELTGSEEYLLENEIRDGRGPESDDLPTESILFSDVSTNHDCLLGSSIFQELKELDENTTESLQRLLTELRDRQDNESDDSFASQRSKLLRLNLARINGEARMAAESDVKAIQNKILLTAREFDRSFLDLQASLTQSTKELDELLKDPS